MKFSSIDVYKRQLIDRIGHAADLGDHAARDNAGGLVALDLGDLHLGDCLLYTSRCV